MAKIQINPLLKTNPPYKMDRILELTYRLFSIPLHYLDKRISKWDSNEIYAWALGFSVGDASLDRSTLVLKRIDLETSRIGTMICFLAVFRKLTLAPIRLKFYIRSNSYARYKMRAFVKVPKETLYKLALKHPYQLKEVFTNKKLLPPFLGGFIDSDGSIQPYVKSRGKKTKRFYFEPEITLLDENKELLEYLSNTLLKQYFIRSSVKFGFNGNCYRLRINSIEDICALIQVVHKYLINVERAPKASIIRNYCNKIITTTQEIKIIYNNFKNTQNKLKNDLTELIQLMVKNNLKLIIDQNRITIDSVNLY